MSTIRMASAVVSVYADTGAQAVTALVVGAAPGLVNFFQHLGASAK